jgi:hypothetical protein
MVAILTNGKNNFIADSWRLGTDWISPQHKKQIKDQAYKAFIMLSFLWAWDLSKVYHGLEKFLVVVLIFTVFNHFFIFKKKEDGKV